MNRSILITTSPHTVQSATSRQVAAWDLSGKESEFKWTTGRRQIGQLTGALYTNMAESEINMCKPVVLTQKFH